jgi:hypothetical protein
MGVGDFTTCIHHMLQDSAESENVCSSCGYDVAADIKQAFSLCGEPSASVRNARRRGGNHRTHHQIRRLEFPRCCGGQRVQFVERLRLPSRLIRALSGARRHCSTALASIRHRQSPPLPGTFMAALVLASPLVFRGQQRCLSAITAPFIAFFRRAFFCQTRVYRSENYVCAYQTDAWES